MSGPRVIYRHGFVPRNLQYDSLFLDERQQRLNELCAYPGCRLPYEAPVHWILAEERADGLGSHEFTSAAIRVSKANDVCDYGARCKRPEKDPIHKTTKRGELK